LVEYSADVTFGNALTAAATHRTHFQEMIKMFLRHDANIDAQGPGVCGNPLQTAVWVGHAESVEFLFQHGASKTISGAPINIFACVIGYQKSPSKRTFGVLLQLSIGPSIRAGVSARSTALSKQNNGPSTNHAQDRSSSQSNLVYLNAPQVGQ
jgi:hypothetical protein